VFEWSHPNMKLVLVHLRPRVMVADVTEHGYLSTHVLECRDKTIKLVATLVSCLISYIWSNDCHNIPYILQSPTSIHQLFHQDLPFLLHIHIMNKCLVHQVMLGAWIVSNLSFLLVL
jgi:hypothetical protein